MNTLEIYGAIGDDWDGITDKQVTGFLANMEDGPLTVRINSPGGYVSVGKTIYNRLKEYEPTVIVDGLAASAASVIAMAGKEIVMATGATMMIHDAWGLTIGPASEHEKATKELDLESDAIAAIYAERTGLDAGEIRQMMLEETWFDEQGAIDAGFATKKQGKAKKAPRDSSEVLSAIGSFRYMDHLPKADAKRTDELKNYVEERKRALYIEQRRASCVV